MHDSATKLLVTPMVLCATRGDEELCALLLAHGAELARQDANGVSPLMAAASSGSSALVDRLLALGASPQARDRAAGANPNARSVSGLTALAVAASAGYAELDELLAGTPRPVGAK